MPSLRLQYMVDDYHELTRTDIWDPLYIRPKYMVPDYKKLVLKIAPRRSNGTTEGKNGSRK